MKIIESLNKEGLTIKRKENGSTRNKIFKFFKNKGFRNLGKPVSLPNKPYFPQKDNGSKTLPTVVDDSF